MDIDEFMDRMSTYGNEKELWGEGIIVRANGHEVVGFSFDGNTSLNLLTDEDMTEDAMQAQIELMEGALEKRKSHEDHS